jgi:ubiquinone/menaquinone biosynthesis C-methylase UbiE
MLSRLDHLRYHALQASWLVNATVLQEVARVATRAPRPAIPADAVREIRRRRRALLARDLANVDAGLYPRALLFDVPALRYLRELPELVADAPNVVRRMRANAYHDIPEVDRARFPAYYRRTFHWQTGGYFSAHSAEVYELGVELLFRGMADVMRRQVIPPVTRLARSQAAPLRVLDVACGTGRTLHQLARAHPTMRLYGIDLSPAYVRTARERLRDVGEIALVADNAEAMPWADGAFDAATSTYLFHELPRNARRNVARELHRVVRAGGVVVVEDSAQLVDAGVLADVLRAFPRDFHEPFYADYLEDDLAALLASAGFVVEAVEECLVAKVVVARKR